MKSIPSITLRIDYKTYRNFRRRFAAKRGESAASYFERLSEYLQDIESHLSKFIEEENV